MKYAGRSDGDTIEALSLRLSESLREAIRDLTLAPPLSEEWVASGEKLLRVANISEMEKRIAKDGPAGAEKTLWEGEELALRFLLEDGKLNLSLRLLDQYVDWLVDLRRPLSVSRPVGRILGLQFRPEAAILSLVASFLYSLLPTNYQNLADRRSAALCKV
jgi:hypothetical protein